MVVAYNKNGEVGASHRNCFACGTENENGLGLVFKKCLDNRVKCNCTIDKSYQGYPGAVQGGIIATILDCAMTNCLFIHNIEAMTARLNVQYHLPVLVDRPLVVEAELLQHHGRLYELEASITQDNRVRACACGKFMVPKDAI